MRIALFIIFSFAIVQAKAQNLNYVKQLVDTLTSEWYAGRGYVNNGGNKAATFIYSEFEKIGLQNVAYQNFTHPVNTFPGILQVLVDNTELKAGEDYLVVPSSGGANNLQLKLAFLQIKDVESAKAFNKFLKKQKWYSTAIVVSKEVYSHINDDAIGKALAANSFQAAAIINVTDQKLTWSVRDHAKSYVELEILATSLPPSAKEISITIEQKLEATFKNKNVLGFLPGINNDSLIVFTAHYDHLGRMGQNTCFYGTNDNAGGAAMLCDLAGYYAQNPAKRKYGMLFIAFAGEEAGLLGSKHYVENPIYALEKISLLINLDLVTNGQDGMTVVNGQVFKWLFKRLKKLNDDNEMLSAVKSRGKAANSDHYFFSEKGVKAIFIYLLGDYPFYHDINDTPDKPSWAGYDAFFNLLVNFCDTWAQ